MEAPGNGLLIVCVLVTFYQREHSVMLTMRNLNLISVQSWTYLIRGTKNVFLTPKRFDELPRSFIREFPCDVILPVKTGHPISNCNNFPKTFDKLFYYPMYYPIYSIDHRKDIVTYFDK